MMELLKDKKKTILTICLCIFAVSLIYRVTHLYKQPKVATPIYTGEKAKSGTKKVLRKDIVASSEASTVSLDLFLNPPTHSKEAKKNIFSEQAAIEAQGKSSDKPAAGSGPTIESTAANAENQIKDDLSEFKSFGYAERNGQKILFLEKGTQIMLVRKGDKIEGKYLVKDITQKELTLLVIANNEIVHIDLSQL
jgi:hypothetical protein